MGDDKDKQEILLRVKSTTSVPGLASAISHAIYDDQPISLRAIGAGALSQAVKAIAVARGHVAPRGVDLVCTPGFCTVSVGPVGDEEQVTAITLRVEAW
jgi:stage V sporulation protein S